MDKNETPAAAITIQPSVKLGLLICAAGIIAVGLFSWVYDYIGGLNTPIP
jgi:hypothetical protein